MATLDTLTVRTARSLVEEITPKGRSYRVRCVGPRDADRLTEYFLSLSAETKSLYAPHPFDRETAAGIAGEMHETLLRFVAVGDDASSLIAAYFILFLNIHEADTRRYSDFDRESCCSIAPSVRDELQNCGLGTAMMEHVVDVARRMGKRSMILCGGVVATNRRAIHFYERFGFVKVREFGTGRLSYDMVLDLADPRPAEARNCRF